MAALRREIGQDRAEARRRGRGIGLALGATALWSTTGLLIDALTSTYRITTLELSLWRCMVITLALLLIASTRRGQRLGGALWPSRASETAYYAGYGLVGIAAFTLAWTASVTVNKAAVATALIYSSAVFVALGDRFFFRTRLAALQWGAIALNLVGCALAAGVAHPRALLASPAGLVLGLASGLTYSAYTLLGKGARRLPPRGSLSILLLTFLSATAALAVWGLAVEGPRILLSVPLDLPGWALLAGLALGPTLGGYACFTASLRCLNATVASVLTTLEPPLAAVLALLVLGRVMGPLQWAGTALIVAGVVIMQLRPPR